MAETPAEFFERKAREREAREREAAEFRAEYEAEYARLKTEGYKASATTRAIAHDLVMMRRAGKRL